MIPLRSLTSLAAAALCAAAWFASGCTVRQTRAGRDDQQEIIQMTSHRVATDDGVFISFDCYRKPNRDAAVILCPGFFQSKDTPTFQRLSHALAEHVDVLAMDFRGHGRSSGLYTFSAKESVDLEAVLRWAAPRYERLGIIGFSLGGAIAINTLSRFRGRVSSLIAVSTPSVFEEIEFKWWTPEAMRTGLEGMEPGAGCRPGNLWLSKERPLDHIATLSPLPILFIHGTRDAIVGVDHSRRLFAAAGEPKRLEIVQDGGHAEALFRDNPVQFCRLVERWLAETMSDQAQGKEEQWH